MYLNCLMLLIDALWHVVIGEFVSLSASSCSCSWCTLRQMQLAGLLRDVENSDEQCSGQMLNESVQFLEISGWTSLSWAQGEWNMLQLWRTFRYYWTIQVVTFFSPPKLNFFTCVAHSSSRWVEREDEYLEGEQSMENMGTYLMVCLWLTCNLQTRVHDGI